MIHCIARPVKSPADYKHRRLTGNGNLLDLCFIGLFSVLGKSRVLSSTTLRQIFDPKLLPWPWSSKQTHRQVYERTLPKRSSRFAVDNKIVLPCIQKDNLLPLNCLISIFYVPLICGLTSIECDLTPGVTWKQEFTSDSHSLPVWSTERCK